MRWLQFESDNLAYFIRIQLRDALNTEFIANWNLNTMQRQQQTNRNHRSATLSHIALVFGYSNLSLHDLFCAIGVVVHSKYIYFNYSINVM